MSTKQAPIIIRKVVEEGGHAHHGGAWKVAYADFVTAMMAFFLMLWLLSSSDEEMLKGLAEYFSASTSNSGLAGQFGGTMEGALPFSPNQLVPMSVSPFNFHPAIPYSEDDGEGEMFQMDLFEEEALDEKAERGAERERREQAQFAQVHAAIIEALDEAPGLSELAKNLRIDQTPEGLRIQIVDQHDQAMFPLASAEMLSHTEQLIEIVAAGIKDLPNRLSIRGHTDALPFATASGYDNWRLSSDRANSTREALVAAGVASQRIREVIGRADADPYVKENPTDPRNRRVSLVLLHEAPSTKTALKKPPVEPEDTHEPLYRADGTAGKT